MGLAAKKERVVLLRCLATTFAAGMPLVVCLEVLARQCQHPETSRACGQASRLLQSGETLARALKSQKLLDELSSRLVEIGERTGSLHAALEHVARHQERLVEQELTIRRSLTLPALTLVACLLLVTIVPCLLFDGIFQFLTSSGFPIPAPTRLLIQFAALLKQPLFWLCALPVAFLLSRHASVYLPPVLRRIPLYRKFLAKQGVLRFTRTTAMMLELGVPLLETIHQAGRSTHQAEFEAASQEVAEAISLGRSLPQALGLHPGCFPPSLVQAAQAGEECGRLPELLTRLSDLYELELETALASLTRAAEPLVLALVGGIVGISVVATMLPLVDLLNRL